MTRTYQLVVGGLFGGVVMGASAPFIEDWSSLVIGMVTVGSAVAVRPALEALHQRGWTTPREGWSRVSLTVQHGYRRTPQGAIGIEVTRACLDWRPAEGTASMQLWCVGVGARLTVLVDRRARKVHEARQTAYLAAIREEARTALLGLWQSTAPAGMRVAVTANGEDSPFAAFDPEDDDGSGGVH